jgi:hypothetical protein
MNIYKGIQIPESHKTPDYLAGEASRFADVLASGRWHQKRIHKVERTQTIVETVGTEYEYDESEIEPIYNEITISFSALKRYFEDEDGPSSVPHYHIESTTAQGIDKHDIPRNVLDEIFANAIEDEGHDVIDELGIEDDELTEDNLDSFGIQRIQEDGYAFNHLGVIEEYTTSYRYTFDDSVVHEVGHMYEVDEGFMWRPVELSEGSANENKLIGLASLNEASIETALKNFDVGLQEFLIVETHPELREVLPEKEHIKRILGMIGMLSNGYVDLRTGKRHF